MRFCAGSRLFGGRFAAFFLRRLFLLRLRGLLLLGGFALARADETLRTEADQIFPVRQLQRFVDQLVVFRVLVLHERALHCFFSRVLGHVDRLHRPRVKPRIIHDGRKRRGRGIKVLHLLGLVGDIAQIFCQRDGVFHCAAGVRGHEIRHQELVHTLLLVELRVFFGKTQIDAVLRLSHLLQNRIRYMLRRDLQLPGDVIAYQLLEKHVRGVREHVVKADAAADKDLLDAGNCAQLPKKREIVRVVGNQIPARRGEQALPVLACAPAELLFARRLAEIRCGTADIVDIALEFGVARHETRLFQ